MTEPERPAAAPPRSRRFPTTRWSVVRAAGAVDDPADVAAELSYLLDVLARRHRTSSLNQP